VAYLLKARIVKPTESLLGNGFVNKPLAKHRLSGRHVKAAKDRQATTGELLEAEFSL
jgi:hypothetical protein